MGFDGQDMEGVFKDVQLVLEIFPGSLWKAAAISWKSRTCSHHISASKAVLERIT